jgi:hypothetical protein
MKRAIELVEKNRVSFQKLVAMKTLYVPTKQVESITEQARTELAKLFCSEGRTMKLTDWINSMDTTSNRNEKYEIKALCLQYGWIREVSYSELTQEQREKYNIIGTNSHLIVYVKGM